MPLFPLGRERRRVVREVIAANHLARPEEVRPERWTDLQDGQLPVLEGDELRALCDLAPGLLTRLRALPTN